MEKEMDYPKAVKLALLLLRLMRERQGCRVESILKELGITKWTLKEYREALRQVLFLGWRDGRHGPIPELVQKGGVLRLERIEQAPDADKDFETKFIALNLASQVFSFLGRSRLGVMLAEAYNDMASYIRSPHKVFAHDLLHLERKFLYIPWAPKDYKGKESILDTLLFAIEQQRRLEVTYRKPGEEPWTRLLDPLTLVVVESALYVIVRYSGTDEYRTLAVDRIDAAARNTAAVKEVGASFYYPSRDDYDPRQFVEGNLGVWGGGMDALPIDVELVFEDNPYLKQHLRERRWHPTQRFEDLPDGRLKLTMSVRSMASVWPWVRIRVSGGGEEARGMITGSCRNMPLSTMPFR